MATKIASLFAEIGADASGLKKALSTTKTELKGAAKEMDKTLSGVTLINKAIGEFATGVAIGGAALLGFGVAAKGAFDFGRQGAAIAQTSESFERLMRVVGAAPDTLAQLRTASRNTVDDMSLMSSTMTLLAGASGTLATELANATPQLMEIAKAANKLNPTLGDTTFMYQSLATGIKRASPLILDNLGLTIKVGDANQRMADQLGKSVDALTAEEKQMALLNDTIRAGRVLIDQVGGSTDSAVDNFDRLTASIKNMADAFKSDLSGPIADVIGFFGELVTVSQAEEDAVATAERQAFEAAGSYDEYTRALKTNLGALSDYLEVQKDGTIVINSVFGLNESLIEQTQRRTREEVELQNALGQYTVMLPEQAAAMEALSEAYRTGDTALLAYTVTLPIAAEAADATAYSFDNLATSASTLAKAFGSIKFDNETMWNLAVASGASAEVLADLAVRLGIADQAQISATLTAYGLAESLGAGELNARSYMLAFQDIPAALTAAKQEQWATNAAMIAASSIFGEAAGQVNGYSMAVDAVPTAVTTTLNTDGFEEAIALANGVAGALARIPRNVVTSIAVNRYGIDIDTGRIPGRQSGGTVNEPFTWVGEAGPELVALPRGSQVIPHEQSRDMMGGGIGNLTLNIQGAGNPEATAAIVMRKLADRGLMPRAALR